MNILVRTWRLFFHILVCKQSCRTCALGTPITLILRKNMRTALFCVVCALPVFIILQNLIDFCYVYLKHVRESCRMCTSVIVRLTTVIFTCPKSSYRKPVHRGYPIYRIPLTKSFVYQTDSTLETGETYAFSIVNSITSGK